MTARRSLEMWICFLWISGMVGELMVGVNLYGMLGLVAGAGEARARGSRRVRRAVGCMVDLCVDSGMFVISSTERYSEVCEAGIRDLYIPLKLRIPHGCFINGIGTASEHT